MTWIKDRIKLKLARKARKKKLKKLQKNYPVKN